LCLRGGALLGDPDGVGLAEGEVLGLADGSAVGLTLGLVEGLAVVVADGSPLAEAVGDDVPVELELVGDGLGVPDGGLSGSQDWALTAAVRLAAAAVPEAAAKLNPDAAAATSAPPVIRAAVAGRTCAKRMRTPHPCCRCCPERFACDSAATRPRIGHACHVLAAFEPPACRGRQRCLTRLTEIITE
jgi:hypothetical protein